MDSEKPEARWLKWVALTTTILAVCTAIASLKGSSFSTRVQLSTTDENNAWAYFQSKSIKQHACELQRDSLLLDRLGARRGAAAAYLDKKIAEYEADIARYDVEKAQIQTDAKRKAALEEDYKRHSATMNLAVMLLQLGILLSSIGALVRARSAWVLGLGIGLFGLLSMANGIYLWF